ncbi:MAG: hypothetical protein ACODAJ_08425 [Planctomycetota bacterium]
MSAVLDFSERVACVPIVHGSGDFALEVRRRMLAERFDCVAVPLPPSFQADVEAAVERLPAISMVVQPSSGWVDPVCRDAEEPSRALSYVPVDPCQGAIMALRIALQERMARAYVDLEVADFVPSTARFPDAYALKKVRLERFAAAVLPAVPPPQDEQTRWRVETMAARLRALEERFERILFVCSLLDWPWVRQAWQRGGEQPVEDDAVEPTTVAQPTPETLFFLLGELPFITGLYERARQELGDDEHLAIDGIKELLIETRERYARRFKALARDLGPQTLSLYLKYVRNLSLIESRLAPDLYTLVLAAKQMAGDSFALELAETAREYPYQARLECPEATLGIGRARLPDGEIVRIVSRLPGPVLTWRRVELKPRPPRVDQVRWRRRWNPFGMCSWLPEDDVIERFRTRVMDRARTLIGLDLARSEKFTTSLKDGLDIRETLRHFYDGDLYVKVNPPVKGDLDCVVMFFDVPADPRDYPWRMTWFAETEWESTLAFYATHYLDNLVGPGIGQSVYGGALFLYPPRSIPQIWEDERLEWADTLEERLLAAACVHSEHRHIAVLSPVPPSAAWRRMARRFGKRWVHVPLSRFSASTVRQLRLFHVLNGRHVRSYAAHFIRSV